MADAPNAALAAMRSAGLTYDQIGQVGGVTKQQVAKWMAGQLPQPDVRQRYQDVLEIDVRAWLTLPGAPLPDVAPAPEPAALEQGSESDDAIDVETLLVRRLRVLQSRIAQAEQFGTAQEYTRLVALEAKLAIDLAKVRRELTAVDEDRLVATPTFQRLVALIVDAVRPWPDAAAALEAALSDGTKG